MKYTFITTPATGPIISTSPSTPIKRCGPSGGGPVVGWFNTKLFDETGDVAKAQGWTAFVLDTSGDGKRGEYTEPNQPFDPSKDRRIAGNFYAVSVNPIDGSIWGTVGVFGGRPGVVRVDPGANPPETAISEIYYVPSPGYGTRGGDIDSHGVMWISLGSGHLASFDRSKCKGPLNGPKATGDHCPEGWAFYKYPGPGFDGIGDNSAESSYYTWVDQHNTSGLGNDVPISTANLTDGLAALKDGKMITLRLPYPMGFYAKGLDGRIDDPSAGWKGRRAVGVERRPCAVAGRGRQGAPHPPMQRCTSRSVPIRSPTERAGATCAVGGPGYGRSPGDWRHFSYPRPGGLKDRGESRAFFRLKRRSVTTTIGTMRACLVLVLSLILPGSPAAVAQADAQPDQSSTEHAILPSPGSRDSICLMIESAARANDLPVEYFARVIWQESRFQPDAVGPTTRNGQRAQGIAQFMPGTAAERRLLDPLDPGRGAAEVSRVSGRIAQPVRQSRPGGGRQPRRPGPAARIHGGQAAATGGDPQLRDGDHRDVGRRLLGERYLSLQAKPSTPSRRRTADGRPRCSSKRPISSSTNCRSGSMWWRRALGESSLAPASRASVCLQPVCQCWKTPVSEILSGHDPSIFEQCLHAAAERGRSIKYA